MKTASLSIYTGAQKQQIRLTKNKHKVQKNRNRPPRQFRFCYTSYSRSSQFPIKNCENASVVISRK